MKKTHSEAFPREFHVDRSGAYNRVVVYGRYVNPPKAIDAFMELNTLDEVRQIRDLLTAVLEEGVEPDQPPAVDSYFNQNKDALKYKTPSENALKTGLFDPPDDAPEEPKEKKPKKSSKKSPPKQQSMFPDM